MKTNHSIIILLITLILGCNSGTSNEKSEEVSPNTKPNVLFIMVDDLNDWTGFLKGHPQSITPHMDSLASQGMVFSNAHTNAPLCGPSRSSMLTGLRPSSTGIYFHIADPDLVAQVNNKTIDATLLPNFFEQNGYQTFGVGKIFHRGDAGKVFDEYGGLSNFGPRPEKRFVYDPKWFGKPTGTSTDWGAFPEHDSLTFDKRIADWAIERLQREHHQPFFLAAGFMRPHVPWYVPQKWLKALDSLEITVPAYLAEDWNDLPEMAAQITDLEMMPEMEWMLQENRWQDAVKAYLASVHFVDHQIGRLLKVLQQSAYAKNTIVVLASDHGYHLGEKGLFQKSTLWYRSTHIPMIWAGKGIQKGCTVEPASLLDIYPTLSSMAGLAPPAYLEGKSLSPILKKEKESIANAAVTTYGPNNHSIIYQNWHYIQYNDGSEELYDLNQDKEEHFNVSDQEKHKDIKRQLKQFIPTQNLPNNEFSELKNTSFFIQYQKNKAGE